MSSVYFVLLLAAAAIYVFECVAWMPEHCIALSATLHEWHGHAKQVLAGGLHKRVVFGSLFPSRGISLVQGLPPLISPNALCICKESERADLLLAETQFSSSDCDVRAAKRSVLAMPSKQAADRMALFLSRVCNVSQADRGDVITKEMARLLDTRAVRRKIRIFRLFAPWLSGGALIAITYAVTLALTAERFGIQRVWPLSLAMLAVLAHTIWTYCRAYVAVWPDESVPWRHLLPMILAPPSGLRSLDCLARELCSEYHWLPVAKVSMDSEVARELTYAYWRKLTFPAIWEQECCATAQSAIREWQSAVFRFINENYGDPQVALLAPVPKIGCAAYCPRCQQQFVDADLCSDCGIVLLAFSSLKK